MLPTFEAFSFCSSNVSKLEFWATDINEKPQRYSIIYPVQLNLQLKKLKT